ncbi:MAG: CSLREA domain-containing protein, partial [Dehalococcoidia bacterium]
MKNFLPSKLMLIIMGLSTLLFLILAANAAANTYTVDTTNDSDNTCGDGDCSLREAINEANSNSGTDTIEFAISGTGPFTIQPASALPDITDPIIIDGYSQPGASPNTLAQGNDAVLMIELDGSGAGSVDGLHITAGCSTIKGLAINSFGDDGIQLDTAGANLIEGNFIGTDASGTSDLGNSCNGILIDSGTHNIIGGGSPSKRNLLSGNNHNGIRIQGGSGAEVLGNYIGTSASGSADLGNNYDGVYIYSSTTGNRIGGTGSGEGNLISGNNSDGISISSSDENIIQGNIIGLEASGTSKLMNTSNGIYLTNSPENTIIGGTSPAARNIISGNGSDGIEAYGLSTAGNGIRITGNYIGTDITGTVRLGNYSGVHLNKSSHVKVGGTGTGAGNLISGNSYGIIMGADGYTHADNNIIQGNLIGTNASGTLSLYNSTGIRLSVNTHHNVIGGTSTAARNIISGNNTGIYTGDAENTLIQGNYIGTDITGSNPLGNTNYGIILTQNYTSKSNTIGGTAAAAANIIAYNGVGIAMTDRPPYGAPTQNAILGNSIHSNTGLGIDLHNDGVTANDPGDADSGENMFQNFPSLTAATVCGGTTTIEGILDSTPSTQFRLEFFSN